jgi:hypothetical protein
MQPSMLMPPTDRRIQESAPKTPALPQRRGDSSGLRGFFRCFLTTTFILLPLLRGFFRRIGFFRRVQAWFFDTPGKHRKNPRRVKESPVLGYRPGFLAPRDLASSEPAILEVWELYHDPTPQSLPLAPQNPARAVRGGRDRGRLPGPAPARHAQRGPGLARAALSPAAGRPVHLSERGRGSHPGDRPGGELTLRGYNDGQRPIHRRDRPGPPAR